MVVGEELLLHRGFYYVFFVDRFNILNDNKMTTQSAHRGRREGGVELSRIRVQSNLDEFSVAVEGSSNDLHLRN